MKPILTATLLATFTATTLHAAPVVWKAAAVSGTVSVQTNNRRSVDLQPGSTIAAGGTLRTGPSGQVTLAPVPGTELKAGHNTQLRDLSAELRKGGGRSVRLALTSGELMAAHSKGDLVIGASCGRVATNGAVFSMRLSPREELLVVVASGSVDLISANGKKVQVNKGQFVTATCNGKDLIVSAPAAASSSPEAAQALASLGSFFDGSAESRAFASGSSEALETRGNAANFSGGAGGGGGGSAAIRSEEK